MRKKILQYTAWELECFVRERLGQKNIFDNTDKIIHGESHLKFDFAGFDDIHSESCFVNNNKLLFLFSDCGIFDYVTFATILAWKGSIDLLYQFHQTNTPLILEQSGYGTVEIIIEAIQILFIEPTKDKNRQPKREVIKINL